MKLQSHRFYDESVNYESYHEIQISRHDQKASKKRGNDHYAKCASKLIEFVDLYGLNMLCLGTRNNYERDEFAKSLTSKNVSVFSLDIAPSSNADFIMDFNDFPDDWFKKWDIVFSNSLDHALDSTIVFEGCRDIVKSGGLLMVGFDLVNDICVDKADCNSFKAEHVREFFDNVEGFDLVGKVIVGYEYFILRKI